MNILFYFWIAAQIIAESFPISSSGHQLLYAKIMHAFGIYNHNHMFHASIAHLLHIPTVVIVLIYFWSQLKGISTSSIKKNAVNGMVLIGIVDCISAFSYFFLIPSLTNSVILFIGFTLTALLLYYSHCFNNKIAGLSLVQQAIVVGIVQSVAFIPGISRLALIYIIFLALGYPANHALALSWLVVLPLLTAAVVKSVITVTNRGLMLQLLQPDILLVIIICSIIAGYSFVWFAVKASRQEVKGIARYMIVPIILTGIVVMIGL